MELNQTVYVLDWEKGNIEERVIVKKGKNERLYTLSKEEYLAGEGKEKFAFNHWCFETIEEVKTFELNYKKEIEKKIKNTNIMQDMFNAWAREYSDEKDYIQKIAMVEFLKEKYDIEINLADFYKRCSWECDAKDFRLVEKTN